MISVTTQIATKPEWKGSTAEWGAYLEKHETRLQHWCSDTGLEAATLRRIAVRELAGKPQLRLCTPESVFMALTEAAQLGLEPTGISGEGHLVPYKGRCQFVPGYPGLIKLALQSKHVRAIWTDVIREGDTWELAKGSEPRLHHVPNLGGDKTGALVAAYACADMGGRVIFEVMRRSEIEAIRKASPYGDKGPWVEHYDEMSRKTAVRRICKFLPKGKRLNRALAIDERADAPSAEEYDEVTGEVRE